MISKTERDKNNHLHIYYFVRSLLRNQRVFLSLVMNKLSILIFLVFLMVSCKEKKVNLGSDSSFEIKKNVSYGNDPEQEMDLYIPTKPNKDKDVFIMIHGGGWRSGNKSEISLLTFSMMKKFPNSVFANINYRLASNKRFAIPNQTDDINDVILYLEKKLQYKPRFILIGNSAGAHLSILYAYKSDKGKKVKAAVNIVGPSDLSDANFKNYSDYYFVEKNLVDPEKIPSTISKENFASPVKWINTNTPPTISFYGNNDQVIPLSQKVILDSTLNVNHVENKSFEFNGGHLDWNKESNIKFLINKIDEFLKQIDKNKTL